MPSQNSQAYKKFVSFAILPFPCLKVHSSFFLFLPSLKREEIISTNFPVKELIITVVITEYGYVEMFSENTNIVYNDNK